MDSRFTQSLSHKVTPYWTKRLFLYQVRSTILSDERPGKRRSEKPDVSGTKRQHASISRVDIGLHSVTVCTFPIPSTSVSSTQFDVKITPRQREGAVRCAYVEIVPAVLNIFAARENKEIGAN